MMKNLGQRYVQYVNRTYQRTGTLWEGRFRSCLAQSEDYVLACHRYIELNPVRAGMVSTPQDYHWPSYRANRLGKANALLTPHDQYQRLGQADAERSEAYRALFRAPADETLTEEIRAATNANLALGSPKFQAQIAQVLGRRVTRGVAGRPVSVACESGKKQGRLV